MNRHTQRRAALCSLWPTTLAGLAFGLLQGCQSYEPRPLDLDETRQAWLARSAGDQNVQAFARHLAHENPASAEFDPADGLTASEGEVVALVFNPDLRQARLEAGVSAAAAGFAGLWEDPVLGVDLERVVRGASGADPWVAGGTVGITIPLSGRLEAAKSRADAHAKAELDRVAAREWATRTAVRELWIEWSAARLRADLSRKFVSTLSGIVEIAARQEQAGHMSRLDARLFKVELASRQADQLALDGRARELELQLRGMLGVSPRASVELLASVLYAPSVLVNRVMDEATLLSELERTSPELAAVRSEYEVAEQSLREQVRKQYPDLVIGPGYGRDQGDDRMLLGVQLPLPLWNRNRQGVAEAKAEREAARGRFESTFEHLASRLAIAVMRYQSGRAQREAVESVVVPLVDEQEADARRVAALGRVDPLMLLESLKRQHEARLTLIDARATESIGAARVCELIGPLPAARPPSTSPERSPASHPE